MSQTNLTPEVEEKIYHAFDKIHDLGVVHGDPNVDNILVSATAGEPSVWIIDFEFARDGDDDAYKIEDNAIKELIECVKRGEKTP